MIIRQKDGKELNVQFWSFVRATFLAHLAIMGIILLLFIVAALVAELLRL